MDTIKDSSFLMYTAKSILNGNRATVPPSDQLVSTTRIVLDFVGLCDKEVES
jgi:hypothetical protein